MGVAMGAAGSEVAIQSATIALMNEATFAGYLSSLGFHARHAQ